MKRIMKSVLEMAVAIIIIALIVIAMKGQYDRKREDYKPKVYGDVDINLNALPYSEDSDDTLKTDTDDVGMYLSNDSGVLPVIAKNVYQQSQYGYTTVIFDMVNMSDDDIKEAGFGVVAWDANGLPLELRGVYDIVTEDIYKVAYDNLAAGTTKQVSIDLDGQDFKYMQILLLEYSDFDGNTWTNPAADYYEENYAGKKLDETTMNVMKFEKNINGTNDNMPTENDNRTDDGMLTDSVNETDDSIQNQENTAHCTGDFCTDVANGVLYGKDGIIVDINGNALPEYAEYSVTEEGYLFNGDWCEEGYCVDSTGKVVQFHFQ